MKKLISLLLAIMLSVSLVSCGELEFYYYEDNLSNKADDGAVTWSCDIRYPFFKGGCSDEINAALDPYLRKYQTEAKDYQAEALNVYENIGAGCTFELDAEGVECAEGYVSVRFTSYQYLGGAHGGSSGFGVVFDEKSGDTVSAEELLGVSKDELNTLLRNELTAMIEASPEMFYPDALELIDTALFAMGTFYLEGTELVFTVPEYEIAPYVSGIQYVRIPIAS